MEAAARDWAVLLPGWGSLWAALSANAAARRGAALQAAGRSRQALAPLARAARRGVAEAAYRLGRSYLQGAGVPASRGEARAWLEAAAEQGHADAQLLLATLCLSGLGAPQAGSTGEGSPPFFRPEGPAEPDSAAAARWARRAAESGSAEAQALLASLLSSGPQELRDPDEAARLYRQSAAAGCPRGLLGHALALCDRDERAAEPAILENLRLAAEGGLPQAVYLLGVASERGLGQPPDPAQAVRQFRRAAEMGHPAAQARWGAALIHGSGVDADPGRGETWLRRAALAGDASAAALLGDRYAAADGTCPPRFAEAALWYRRAAAGGHRGAARSLGQLYLTGAGVAPDAEQAASWFRLSATAGDAAAQAELGNLLLGGAGSPDDRSALCLGFAQAAQAGDSIAAFNYGVCLAEGVGTARDDEAAAHWFRKASATLADARFWYGRFLFEGRGVPRDAAQGRALIASAAEAGMTDAQTLLARLAPDGREEKQASRAASYSVPARFGPITRGHAGGPEGAPPPPEAKRPAGGANAPIPLRRPEPGEPADARCPCGSGLPPERCCALPAGWRSVPEDRLALAATAREAAQAAARGELAAAERLCLETLAALPDEPVALLVLAGLRKDQQKVEAAEALLRRLVAGDPNHLQATHELATLLFERSAFGEAETHARNAIRLAPAHPRSHIIFGMVLAETQRPHLAEVHYRQALALAPRPDPILLANLAWSLKAQSRLAEARACYAQSVAQAPEVFQTWFGWAQLEEADGCLAAAQDKLDRAAAIRPGDPALRLARARLLARQGRRAEALALLAEGGEGEGDEAQSSLLAERGHLLDALGRYDEAFACFDRSKALARASGGKAYREALANETADQLRHFFRPERLRLLPALSDRAEAAQPIFILGFPRSGTTLAEQVLSAHPLIRAGDELPFINDLAEEMPRLLGSPLPYPAALAELWMADKRPGLQALRDAYLQRAELLGLLAPGAAWFTDKMPLNETHLGLIALLFPRSPLIHLIRHPLDVVLSVYAHHLTHGYFCAFELEAIAKHYVLVTDLVDHYREQLPLRYLPLRYETLVSDFEASVRRMTEHVGVAFDERCVSFQDNRRVPQTPSYAQVKEPIHSRATFRHRHYRRHLLPALDILRPLIQRLGYEAE